MHPPNTTRTKKCEKTGEAAGVTPGTMWAPFGGLLGQDETLCQTQNTPQGRQFPAGARWRIARVGLFPLVMVSG